jgi:hypothetical protein
LKIAAERVEKDNRDRWMATRALGLLGDQSVVPELVHLTYHYNSNTRWWAQISLVRLTGQNFGRDVAAWRRWWKGQGGKPPISDETVAWATSAEMAPYADPGKQEESDRQFVERAKARAQQAEAPRGDVPGTAPSPVEFPQDAKLTEAQRQFRDWTGQQFGGLLNAAAAQNLSDEEKAAQEKEWLHQLATLEGRARNPAINGLAILRSKGAVPGLLKVAADRAERDNQDRWMAARALGMIGDQSVVPELVHLTYHYNLNTRWWAQISLVRLTGQNFGRDVTAWRQWWDKEGRKPAISEETIRWTTNAEWADRKWQDDFDRRFLEGLKGQASADPFSRDARKARPGGAPQIVATSPAVGATDVDPATTEITVTFDRDMSDGFSWTGGGPDYPPTAEGKKVVWRDRRTCVLPVKLEPGRYYRVGINSKSYRNFRSADGVSARPSAIYFTTRGAGEEMKARTRKPEIVSMSPANGAKDVDPNLTEIRVTFSVPMGGGFSWTGGGPQFPKVAEGKRPSWSEDRKTCVLPVELKPGWEYRLGLNSPSHKNFQSEGGVPLDPVVYTFTTRGE